MEYYLISLIFTIIIFSLIQLYEYNKIKKNNEENNYYEETYILFNMNNLLLLIILYIVLTISFYYLNISKWTFFDNIKKVVEIKKTGGNINNNDIIDDIDPKILSKINDNFNVGFEPFTNDNDDTSSISSLSSTSIIVN